MQTPVWRSRYFLAFYVGLILGLFGAAQQAVQILSRIYPDWGTVAGAFLIGLALFVNVLPHPDQIVHPPPQVNVESAPNMTLNTESPAPEPPPAPIPGDRPAVRKGPRALN
jgi:hypothetical protein